MTLELYHLHLSQSERLVWLLEEMQIPYTLKNFERNPKTGLAPEDLKAINPTGTAPYFRDTSVSPAVAISESTAIATYILTVYSAGAEGTRMVRTPGDPDYAQYLEWYHFANGSLQPSMSRQMTMQFAGVSLGHFQLRLANQLRMVDSHLVKNKWFAGEEVSAADCMIMFSLSTFRGFSPLDLTPYPNILRWMRDVAARPAYQRALAKGDQGMEPMIEAKVRKFTQFEAFRASLEKVVL